MADDIEQGGTQTEGETGSKTYNQEDLDKLLADARAEAAKEGEAKAHKHWQSVADKQISQVKEGFASEVSKRDALINEMRQARFQSMSPEERQQAMLEEIYNREIGGAGAKQASESAPQPSFNAPAQADFDGQADPREAAQKEIAGILTDMGLDPGKVDWGNDVQGPDSMKRFLASVVAQTKQPEQKKSEDPEESEAERINSQRGSAPVDRDILKMDPLHLISEGLKESKPRRLLG